MEQLPFQLNASRIDEQDTTEDVRCEQLIRQIKGRRYVYSGSWNDKDVIVKIFADKFSGGRHLERERRGLRILQEHQLDAPKLLFAGKTKKGQRVLVTEKIGDTTTMIELYNQMCEPEEKKELVLKACRALAAQNQKGVLQDDLHLGNFLLKDDTVFALDTGQMRFFNGELSRNKSIEQLAKLACCAMELGKEAVDDICRGYFKQRGWQLEQADRKLLQKLIAKNKKETIKRTLKKTLRTGKRYLQIQSDNYKAVFRRGFCKDIDPDDFIGKLDKLMNAGEIFKRGNTCYVSKVNIAGNEIVIKRYNNKGMIHSIRHTVKRSRAWRGWLHGHRLEMLSINTPRPIAYIEIWAGPIIQQSYLVTEYVKGQKMDVFLGDSKISPEQKEKVTWQVWGMLGKLGRNFISHGDLKPSNILITEDGPVLTDLDGLVVHKSRLLLRYRQAKDHARIHKLLVK